MEKPLATKAFDAAEPIRTGMSVEALKKAFVDNLFYEQGRPLDVATLNDQYMALAYTVRDRLLQRWIEALQTYKRSGARTVCYLSAEYLLGPQLANNLINLGVYDNAKRAVRELGLDFGAIVEHEEEPGLGNGGLGRLAACYLDSLATLQIPSIGYGIRYEFGIFDQTLLDGWQLENTDLWLSNGNPWELYRPKIRFAVQFGGHVESHADEQGRVRFQWIPELVVNGVAYDTPILGFGVANANLLRLWKSEACKSFDFQAFNAGDYYGAVHAKVVAETISKVLYPNDEPSVGKELRLKQQYFFASCSIQDMIRLHLRGGGRPETFHEKFAIQLNDTHPAIAVAELMRLLVDKYQLCWDQSWAITRRSFAYTNHTLLPEALETWSVELFQRVLPRHLQIIYEINRRFLDEVRMRFPGEEDRIARLSLIDEHGGRRVRMANLATVGSFAVNGVAALHTELLKATVLKDFYEFWPEKFHNVTNGVTPRRVVQVANPGLCALLTCIVGTGWAKDLNNLRALEQYADDPGFLRDWRAMKLAAKHHLVRLIKKSTGIVVDPHSLFDIQVKRIHEYKRQHLNLLHVLTLYNRIKQHPNVDLVPRTVIFGGKAAPGYRMAKLIIKLINAVSEVISRDPQVNGHLRVIFVPDFNVKNAQPIYPAADLSEQISTAGKEASGTGNMKFAMNGALTIGTLDGANVEIREQVGPENFFLFGLTAEQAARTRIEGYRPWEIYHDNRELKAAVDLINSGLFSHGDKELFRPLTESLLRDDPFLLFADYQSYIDTQTEVDHAFRDVDHWCRKSILTTARMGQFSSDRSIREYCERIWKVSPLPVEVTS